MLLNTPDQPDKVGNPTPESHERRKVKVVILQISIKRLTSLSASLPFRYACCGPKVYYVSDLAFGGIHMKLAFVANFRLVKVSLRWA